MPSSRCLFTSVSVDYLIGAVVGVFVLWWCYPLFSTDLIIIPTTTHLQVHFSEKYGFRFIIHRFVDKYSPYRLAIKEEVDQRAVVMRGRLQGYP